MAALVQENKKARRREESSECDCDCDCECECECECDCDWAEARKRRIVSELNVVFCGNDFVLFLHDCVERQLAHSSPAHVSCVPRGVRKVGGSQGPAGSPRVQHGERKRALISGRLAASCSAGRVYRGQLSSRWIPT